MKKLFFALCLMICFIALFGCSDNATGPSTGGGPGTIGGGPGTGGGGVTFTVTVVQDQQGNFFSFTPSTPVVINTVTANCPAAGVTNEQVTADGTTVYSANSPAYVGPVNALAQGQQWSFTISGKLGSSTGTAYTVTANCNVQ